MAWTTPATYTVGQVLTAANLNTYLRDNMSWLGVDAPHCRVFNSAALSATNAVARVLNCDSERVDVGAMHSTSANTERITIPTGGGGWYLLGAHIQWAANATGSRSVSIVLNATTTLAYHTAINLTATVFEQSISTAYQLVAGDFIAGAGLQNSGGALNINAAANYSPEVWASWARI
jgi:hypothetical protein